MKPQKAKDLIKEVAKELDIPEDVAKIIITAFWRKTRTSLSSLSHVRVHISNLGDFVIKPWSIDKAISKQTNIQNYEKTKDHVREESRQKLESILLVKEMLEQEKQRKEFIKLHRKENTDNEEDKNNLEK